MTHRLSRGGLAGFLLTILCAACIASASSPVLVSAVSRMDHGSAGTFDVQLPLSGRSGIECRSVAKGMTLVLSFNQPISSGGVIVSAGAAILNGAPTFANKTMTVRLSSVADAQAVSLSLSSLANAAGEVLVASR